MTDTPREAVAFACFERCIASSVDGPISFRKSCSNNGSETMSVSRPISELLVAHIPESCVCDSSFFGLASLCAASYQSVFEGFQQLLHDTSYRLHSSSASSTCSSPITSFHSQVQGAFDSWSGEGHHKRDRCVEACVFEPCI